MRDVHQKTLAKPVQISGIGLHSGQEVKLEILPARAHHGIVFKRVDSENSAEVAAHPFNITATDLSTTIGSGSSSIATIEHLMAAFAGLGINNAFVKINGAEVPILDGSAAVFAIEFITAGIKTLNATQPVYEVIETFEVRKGDRWMRLEPSNKMKFRCMIDYSSRAIGKQAWDFHFTRKNFIEMASARTFCHVNEVTAMRRMGFALGGSLHNAVVVDDQRVLNKEGLRSDIEFVQHKILDAIGDLGLLGFNLLGKITLNKAGHGVHAEFMNELLKNKNKYIRLIPSENSTQDLTDEVSKYNEEETIPLVAAAMIYG